MVHDDCGTFFLWHHASSQGEAKHVIPQGLISGNRGMQCGDRDEASSSDGGDGRRARIGSAGVNKSRFRGVSFDKKKRKWRVQIKVSACDGVRTPSGGCNARLSCHCSRFCHCSSCLVFSAAAREANRISALLASIGLLEGSTCPSRPCCVAFQ